MLDRVAIFEVAIAIVMQAHKTKTRDLKIPNVPCSTNDPFVLLTKEYEDNLSCPPDFQNTCTKLSVYFVLRTLVFVRVSWHLSLARKRKVLLSHPK